MAYQSEEARKARQGRQGAMSHLVSTVGSVSKKRNAQIEKDEREANFLRQKMLDDADVPWWKRAATGVLTGASVGSAAGPWGALAGGLAGGVLGGTGAVDFGAPTGMDLAGAMGTGMATYRDYQRGQDNTAARDRLLAAYERSMRPGGGVPSVADTSLSGAMNPGLPGALDRARREANRGELTGGSGVLMIPTPRVHI